MLMISQVGYCGIGIAIIWNYNRNFYFMVQYFTLYNTYTCLCAVINSKYEQYVSAGIIAIALAAQYFVRLF